MPILQYEDYAQISMNNVGILICLFSSNRCSLDELSTLIDLMILRKVSHKKNSHTGDYTDRITY